MPRPAPDPTAAAFPPLPDAAAKLRGAHERLAAEALRAAIRRDPSFDLRFDALGFRTFVRDCDRHVLQLAEALEQGRPTPVTEYVDTLVPLFRRRRVPLEDLGTMLLGMLDAARAELSPAAADVASRVVEAGLTRLERPRHYPGDRARNPILQFLWKGAGILD